ncbi:MAG: YIP1 family protein [Gemmatimonadaceae bacterium]|nr:YIP1 family protein [Gemmatimonadaceae bacterium]
MTAPAAPKSADAPGLLDDLIEIWYAPSQVFARRTKGEFLVLMLLLTVVIGALFYASRGAFEGIMRAQMEQAMRRNPNVTPEQLAQGRKVGEYIAIFGGFVGVPLGILILGIFVWLTAKIVGAEEFSYGQGASVAAYSYVPRILGSALVAVQGLVMDTRSFTSPGQLTIGVARVLPPDASPGLVQLLMRVDVFTVWSSVLIGIGICVIGRVPRTKVALAAGIIWAFGAIPSLWALMMEALKGGA